MQVSTRKKTRLKKMLPPDAEVYRGWTVVRMYGCYFGVPGRLDADRLVDRPDFRSHPGVLKAITRAELLTLIDRKGTVDPVRTSEGWCEQYELVRQGGVYHAIPPGAGEVDLEIESERRQAGVISGPSAAEVRARIQALRETVPVEFAGWLPIYNLMGNCGQHPQFEHTFTPPDGYHFTRSSPPKTDPLNSVPDADTRQSWLSRCIGAAAEAASAVRNKVRRVVFGTVGAVWPLIALFYHGANVPLRERLKLLRAAILRLFFVLRRSGGRLKYILRFLHSRSFHSQILMTAPRRLVFLTSAPYTYNQSPWVVEIEDPTTLFFPFVHNGQTSVLDIAASPYFPIVRALLESDQCRGILTHMRSTARLVPKMFHSEVIARKVHYCPLGVKAPRRWQHHDDPRPEHINLLFINSWSQHPGNLQIRGGLDLLEAFAILHRRYPNLRLTLRSGMIPLDEHYHRIIESGWVRVINRFLTPEEMEALHAESHIYLLPAARIHIVSLLQAMAAGLAVVTTDGWGFDEYIDHERNGLIVNGRYGKTSWVDEEAGMLREIFDSVTSPDPVVVAGIVEAVSRLVEDYELRRRLGREARHDVETKYTLENWNRGLKEMFDAAVAGCATGFQGFSTPG